MNMRKITSLIALISFVLLMLTSIILYIVPSGRVAYWAGWRLWALNKEDWGLCTSILESCSRSPLFSTFIITGRHRSERYLYSEIDPGIGLDFNLGGGQNSVIAGGQFSVVITGYCFCNSLDPHGVYAVIYELAKK
ncbi:MAG: DUF4405 domain-containing protein [Desulfuromonadales bacterium]|nr:DUF4405 domain-containing protein [Desulfuromonadales bacterium]